MDWPNWMVYRTDAASTVNFTNGGKNALRDCARQVIAAIGNIALLGPQEGVVWRGQADVEWRLESNATRKGFTSDEIGKREAAMLGEARRIGMDDAQRMGDWEILARLRHHGAVTRLIDFTSDPFVALWFLCDDNSSGSREADGVLLAARRAMFKTIERPYEVGSYERMRSRDPAVLIYSTPPIDPRIAAQRGFFVLHSDPLGHAESPASELGVLRPPTSWWASHYEKQLAKLCGQDGLMNERGRPLRVIPDMVGIVVPASVKPVLLQMLDRNFGFNRSSMFPDFAGLADLFAS